MKILFRFLFISLIIQAVNAATPEINNDGEVIAELKQGAGLSAALEPSAPEVFRAIMAEAEVCRRIVIENDWTVVDGREEIIDDPDAETETIRTRTRSFLAKNGLTKVYVGEVAGPGENDVVLVLCMATTQEPQSTALKVALRVEFAQWATVILNTTELGATMCEDCSAFPDGVYSCEGDQTTVYALADPWRANRIGIGILTKLPKGVSCPVDPDTTGDFGKHVVKDRLVELLAANLGPDVTIGLNECNLSITREQYASEPNAPIVLTRAVQSADLKIYSVEELEIHADERPAVMGIRRKSLNNRVLAQVQAVNEIISGNLSTEELSVQGLAEMLTDPNSVIFSRLAARNKMDNGEVTAESNADAVAFYDDTQRIEAVPAPASYASITGYSQRVPSADSLVTGQIFAAPLLRLSLKSTSAAEEVAAGLFYYAHQNNCL